MNKRAFDLQLLEGGVYFGVQFKPGALRCFFDVDLSEFSEQIVNSKQFVFSHFEDLCAAIYRTNHFYERASICENWLLKKYTSKLSVKFNHALSLIYKSCGTNKISALANDVGCTSRHLSRLFQLYTGLSPKSFMQTIRLQHACKQLHLLRTSSSSMALELGYYDQSHLLKDFKKHFSCSPNRFFNRFGSDFYNSIQT
nr:helix-turn-helix domain-containing protein [Vibrio sinus]